MIKVQDRFEELLSKPCTSCETTMTTGRVKIAGAVYPLCSPCYLDRKDS